jgi:hypothetical protein
MNRRGKRFAFTVAAMGLVVLLGLGFLYRAAIRDHLEGWHFQLTRETETIPRETILKESDSPLILASRRGPSGSKLGIDDRVLFLMLGMCSDHPVICDPTEGSGSHFGSRFEPRELTVRSDADVIRYLKENGWRVIVQRFPWRAYVVMRDNQ